jgi:small subunit ribosomal protein S2
MLTNYQTVAKRVARLKELEAVDFDNVAASGLTKKELLMMRREKDKLSLVLSGIRDMQKLPTAIWVVDTNKEHLAVQEAHKLGITVVGILDTNCDPDVVDFPIPGNDDALRAVGLLTSVITDAIAEGLIARAGGTEAVAEVEPLAEWEKELLEGAEAPVAEAPVADAPVADAPAADAVAADAVAADAVAVETVAELAEVADAPVATDEVAAETVAPAAE